MSARGSAQPGMPARNRQVQSQHPLLPQLGARRNSLGQRAATAGNVSRPPRYGAQHEKSYGGPPNWRKSKKQQVDEKVSSLFESYKAIDRAAYE